MAVKIYSAYDRPGHPGYTFELPTRTQQHFQQECDINFIMDRFTRTGVMPPPKEGYVYGDVSDYDSYQSALHSLMEAQADFDLLPAKVRKEFDNDPAQFLDFIQNPENASRAQELGLLAPAATVAAETTSSTGAGSTAPAPASSSGSEANSASTNTTG